MVSTAVVCDVAERLAVIDIEVMPIKGSLLQHWLYEDPAERMMTDVDLLLMPSALDRAVTVLRSAGYRALGTTSIGAQVLRSPQQIAVDLHPRLFDDARYRLPTAAVFSRGVRDDVLFGARVRVPARLDCYAHLIGKFGSDHVNAAATHRLDEITRMGRLLAETPARTARHLVDVGMRRVARYVLSLAAAAGDTTARDTLAALPKDPVGAVTVRIVDAVLRSPRSDSGVGAVAAHALNHSLPSAARSGARALRARCSR